MDHKLRITLHSDYKNKAFSSQKLNDDLDLVDIANEMLKEIKTGVPMMMFATMYENNVGDSADQLAVFAENQQCLISFAQGERYRCGFNMGVRDLGNMIINGQHHKFPIPRKNL